MRRTKPCERRHFQPSSGVCPCDILRGVILREGGRGIPGVKVESRDCEYPGPWIPIPIASVTKMAFVNLDHT